MFSSEYCEISKNTFFEEHLHTTASEVTLGSDCSEQPLSKPSCLRNVTSIPAAFKPEL